MKVQEFATHLPEYIKTIKRNEKKWKLMYEQKTKECQELQKQIEVNEKKYLDILGERL